MIQLTDVDGKKIWINPSLVLYIRTNIRGHAVLFFGVLDRDGDLQTVEVSESPEEVSKKFKKG